jgi:hypothetical protein
MDNPDCNTCTRKNRCFIKEFTVLSCEDYIPEITAEYIKEKECKEDAT